MANILRGVVLFELLCSMVLLILSREGRARPV
jgi:hypothetical protein